MPAYPYVRLNDLAFCPGNVDSDPRLEVQNVDEPTFPGQENSTTNTTDLTVVKTAAFRNDLRKLLLGLPTSETNYLSRISAEVGETVIIEVEEEV